jgi:NAD(P)-dependent dehydrogenase (short-subunit alcohol dehydrogenase family)
MRFEITVLLATGGASGLRAATARRFADEGAKVVAALLPDVLAVTVDTRRRGVGRTSRRNRLPGGCRPGRRHR